MAPKCSPTEQLSLSHLSGGKKCVFLSHRFLDPTPGLGCDTRELLFLKIFSKGFDVQPT